MTSPATSLPTKIYLAQEIAYLCGKQKRVGHDWMCLCPAHEDNTPSLSLRDGDDGKIIAHCYAHCTYDQIRDALKNKLGIEIDRSRQRAQVFPLSPLGRGRVLEVGQKLVGLPIVARYDYHSEEGDYLFSKYRMREIGGGKTFRILPAKSNPVLYNLPDLKRARFNGLPVYLCEGEKDADSVAALGFISTTAPHGAGKDDNPGKKWKESYTEALKGLDVVIFADNDEPGIKFAQAVATRIRGIASSVKIVEFPELQPGGDVTDYLKSYDKEQLLTKIEASPLFVPPQDVKEFALNEFGNGQRFAYYSNGKTKYCEKKASWISFNGKVWKEDTILSEKFAKEVINLIHKESIFHPTEKQQKAFEGWISKSKKWSGIKNTLYCARSEEGMRIELSELDRHPSLVGQSLLNANNGTIDLRTGIIRPHRKEDYLTRISPYDYLPDAQAPRWERFLSEVFENDEQLIEWFQCFIGYVITGESCLRLFAVLYGKGRNGKSTLVETLSRVLGGDYAKGIPTQSLYAKKEESATSPEIVRLVGTRFAYASEGKEGAKLSTHTVKRFTGDEKITARDLFEKPIDFQPEFTVLFSTNHKPTIDDTTASIWDRTRLIPFNRRFEDQEVDPSLRKTLLSEAPGILNWAVQGAIKFYQRGMNLPDCSAIKDATEHYRSDSDNVQKFLDTMCELGEGYKTQVKTLHLAYVEWSKSEVADEGLPGKTFSQKVKEKGFTTVPGGGHRTFFVGIRLKQDEKE